MIHRTTRTLAGIFAAGILLTGCTGDPAESPATSPSAPPSASAGADPSAPPSPTLSLSAAEQQAFEEATEAIRLYKQTFYNILADPNPNLNDINLIATEPALNIALRSLQDIVNAGETTVQSTGPIVVASADIVRIDLGEEPQTVVLLACVDSTSANGTANGTAWSGPREATAYRLVKTAYLAEPGWAVAEITPPAGQDSPAPC